MPRDEDLMTRALALAKASSDRGEVPVGAVVADPDGEIVGEGGNETLGQGMAPAHAELVAIAAASRHIGNHRLVGCSIHVTLEPCAMCAGAIIEARLARLVFAVRDEKTGACGSRIDLFDPGLGLNRHTTVASGVGAEESLSLLRTFFQVRR